MRVLWFLSFIAVASVFGERISVQKCKEYSKNISKPCVVQEENSASSNEFRHMVLLGFGPEHDKQWMCSGVLISEQFVLTLAHCITNRDLGRVKWVRLGNLDFESPNDSEYLDLKINTIRRHPQYRRPSKYNDIALIELKQQVPFSTYIRPACLYSGNDDALNTFTLTGWISSDLKVFNKGHLERAAGIKIVEHEKCNKTFPNSRAIMNGIIKDTMICAEEPRSVCEFAGGALLQVNSADVSCMFDAVGVSSFGGSRCSEIPVVYTKVSGYIDWIESIVWPQTN